MSSKFAQIYFIVLIIFLSNSITTRGQSINGISGLLSIPTAEMNRDSEVFIGTAFLMNKYLPSYFGDNNVIAGYISVTYFPFLEIGLRVTHQVNGPRSQGMGDRAPNFKLQLFEEGEYLPAIALGGTDFFFTNSDQAMHFNSLFIVGSKEFVLSAVPGLRTSFHFGYGTDILKAKDHQFVGIFGGASFDINFTQSGESALSLMIEHDAQRLNGGVRLKLFNHVNILAGMMGFDKFSGGLSLHFLL